MNRTRTQRRGVGRLALVSTLVGALTGGLTACDGLVKSTDLPPDVTDPAITQTPQGALQAYHGVIVDFQGAIGGLLDVVAISGMLTDELQSPPRVGLNVVNQRDVPEGFDGQDGGPYAELQRVRGQ